MKTSDRRKWLGVAMIVGALPIVSQPVQAGPWEDFLATVVTESRLERLVMEILPTIDQTGAVPISVASYKERYERYATVSGAVDRSKKNLGLIENIIEPSQNNLWKWTLTTIYGHEIPLDQDRPDPSSTVFGELRFCVFGAIVCFADGRTMSTRQPEKEEYLSKIEYVRGSPGPLVKGKKLEWSYVRDFHSLRDGQISFVRRIRYQASAEVIELSKDCSHVLVKGAGCDLAIVRHQMKRDDITHTKNGYRGGVAERGHSPSVWTEAYDLQSGMPLMQLASYSRDFISHNVWDVKLTGSLQAKEESAVKQDLARSASVPPAQREAVRRKFRSGFELFQAGEFAAAELLFRDGLQIEPANEVANFYLAESLSRLNKAAEARHYWQQTIRYAPDSKEAAQARARLQN